MSQKHKLKPCPFCGYKYRGSQIVWKGCSNRFECVRCGVLGPFPKKEDKCIPLKLDMKPYNITDKQAEQRDRAAVSAWNRRPE